MTLQEFLQYASNVGVNAIVGFIMAFLLEVWPWFGTLGDKQKRFVSMALSLAVPILATAALVLLYPVSGDPLEMLWMALMAGFTSFFLSQGVHGAAYLGKKE